MVFFSCDGCAEMLKKNQVDAHARRCRDCESVSCVDCSVSFWGDDYRAHTSCISEAERYEKTVYKGPKKNNTSNRKLTSQELWISIITESLDNCPPELKDHIQNIVSFENVPRKEKAFRNFASNSLKLYGSKGDAIISSLWKHFSAVRQKRANENKTNDNNAKKNQSSEENGTDSKILQDDKKDDSQSNVKSNGNSGDNNDEKNDGVDLNTVDRNLLSPISTAERKTVTKAIKKALKKAPKRQLKLKELRKIIKAKAIVKDLAKERNEWKTIIKEAVLNCKNNLKLDGKNVILLDK